ncbi:hypothetical protein CRG98_036379 [Punica granatum]|uniref:Uncharacterized protein n=1 Tax=Punica granatum TaxID=22663 RepID=A0A2I0IHI8_PUNGR|nr:hypothetical protein CRG98_036379 [Punica granatum]
MEGGAAAWAVASEPRVLGDRCCARASLLCSGIVVISVLRGRAPKAHRETFMTTETSLEKPSRVPEGHLKLVPRLWWSLGACGPVLGGRLLVSGAGPGSFVRKGVRERSGCPGSYITRELDQSDGCSGNQPVYPVPLDPGDSTALDLRVVNSKCDSFSRVSVARPRGGGHFQAALHRLRACVPRRDKIRVRTLP